MAIPLLQTALQDEHAAVEPPPSPCWKTGEYTFLLESLGDSDWQVRKPLSCVGMPGAHTPSNILQHNRSDAAVREAAQYTLLPPIPQKHSIIDKEHSTMREMDNRRLYHSKQAEWQRSARVKRLTRGMCT